MKAIKLSLNKAIKKAGQKNILRLLETALERRTYTKVTAGLSFMLKDGYWYCILSKYDGVEIYLIKSKEIDEDESILMKDLIKTLGISAVMSQEVVENIRVITSRHFL